MKTHLLIFCIVVHTIGQVGCSSVDERPRDSDLAGSYYTVKSGDTLAKIASRSNVPIDEIMYINGIEDQRALRVGQALFLPDPDPIGKKIAKLKPKTVAKKAPAKKADQKKQTPAPAHIFDFPVPGGTIVKFYSQDKKNPYDGIGIKAPKGTRINASLDGNVLFVGDDGTKFGLIAIVEHVEPYITVYAHLERATAKAGQRIKRGEILGYVGQSGGANFPHLHFQIRVNERPKDPKQFLRTLHPPRR